MSAPYAGMTELINGNFADAEGNPVALGYIIMQLNQDAQSSLTSQVVGGRTIKITLDSSGNADTGQYVWPNTALNPTTTFYIVNVYTAAGQLVWGPNYMLVNTAPTFDLDGWVPNQIGSGGAPAGSLVLQTNGVNNGSQQLLNLEQGTNVTIVDDGVGGVTISATGGGGNGPQTRGWRGWAAEGIAGLLPATGQGCTVTGGVGGGGLFSVLTPTATETLMLGLGTGTAAGTLSTIIYNVNAGDADISFTLGILGLLEQRIKMNATSNIRTWVGMMNGGSSAGMNYWESDTPPFPTVAFRYSTAAGDTHWWCVVTDGTTQIASDSGIPVDTNGHVFAIKFLAPNVLFFIDGVQVSSVSISSTTLTTASTWNGFATVDNVGTANNDILYIAYFYWDTTP